MVNSAGCLVVAAGAGAAGTVAYLEGDLEAVEPYKIDTVYAAARETMKKLQLPVLEGKTQKDALSATIAARDAEDKRVIIKLNAQTEETTKISIRVGTFGDHTKSQMIYNRIRENLKAAAPPPMANPVALPPPAQAVPTPPSSQPPVPAPQGPGASAPPQTGASPPAPK